MDRPRAILIANALAFLSFGVAFTLAPAPLFTILDLDASAPAARSDLRAVYGGLELGLALFLLRCARDRVALGLEVASWAMGGLLAVRLLSLPIDRPEPWPTLGFSAAEALAFASLWLGRKWSRAESRAAA